jgi:hypothetical protein
MKTTGFILPCDPYTAPPEHKVQPLVSTYIKEQMALRLEGLTKNQTEAWMAKEKLGCCKEWADTKRTALALEWAPLRLPSEPGFVIPSTTALKPPVWSLDE